MSVHNNDYTRRIDLQVKSIELTEEEAKKHDAIFFARLSLLLKTRQGYGASKHWDIVRKNLDWFRQHNAKAYMVLLD
jgi:hypothetical protein